MSQSPTKSNLFSNSLAVIDSQHKKITINTRSIALEVGKRNGDLNKKIRYLSKNELIDEGKLSPTYYIDSSNRKQKSYDLDEETALQLVMSLSGTKAELMKAELIEWRQSRQDVITPTNKAKASIQWLRLELENELTNSRKPELLHTHIQSAINKAATGHARTKREEMNATQLKLVEWLEDRVHDEIERMKALSVN